MSGAWKMNHRSQNTGDGSENTGMKAGGYGMKADADLPRWTHGMRSPGHVVMHPRGPRGHHSIGGGHHSWKFSHGIPANADIQIEFDKSLGQETNNTHQPSLLRFIGGGLPHSLPLYGENRLLSLSSSYSSRLRRLDSPDSSRQVPLRSL